MPTRQVSVGSTKSFFDQLIDQHAEAYLAAYPDVKEFSSFEKSGTFKYYIGMVWMNDNEKPDPSHIRIRGSQSLAKNKLLELNLEQCDCQQSFFPGQIVAFLADSSLNVGKFLDPINIAPKMEPINMKDKINLIIASGPFVKPELEQEDWSLFDQLIDEIKLNSATHVVLIGPFVDMDNKLMRTQYDTNWKLIFDKLVEGLYQHDCRIFLVPSTRDILPSQLDSNYFYPTSRIDFKLNIKDGVKCKCLITSVTDPAQIDLGGLYLEVTSAEILFHLNKCTTFINKGSINTFTSIFRNILTYGIYPLYPTPNEMAVDFPKLSQNLNLNRTSPHILVLPSKFSTQPVNNIENRLVVTTHKCSTKKQILLIEIPKIESSNDAPIDSVVITNYDHKLIDLAPKAIMES